MNEGPEANHEKKPQVEKKRQLRSALKDIIVETQTDRNRAFHQLRSSDPEDLAKKLLNQTTDGPMFDERGLILNTAPDDGLIQMKKLAAEIEKQRGLLDYRVVLLLSKFLPKHFDISRRYKVFLANGVIPPEKIDQYHRFADIVKEIDEQIKAEKEMS